MENKVDRYLRLVKSFKYLMRELLYKIENRKIVIIIITRLFLVG